MKKIKPLYFLLVILMLNLFILNKSRNYKPTKYYNTQIIASENMKKYSEAVKKYKERKGIKLSVNDLHKTGLIGDSFNDFTTTLGNLESKRTVTNPDTAALVVRILKNCNINDGERVSIAMTGSFTGLNIACIAACEAMNLDYIMISSMGASTYGSNQPDLTFPDIIDNLYKDGYIDKNSSLITLGGSYDVANDIDINIKTKVINNYKERKLNLYINDNYNKNVLKKIEVLNKNGLPKAFICIGGNYTFGDKDSQNIYSEGILRKSNFLKPFGNDKGLINYYLNKNVTTINFLNIKKIFSEYGMPFDPWRWEKTGFSNIYYYYEYNYKLILLTIIFSILYLFYFFKYRSKKKMNNILIIKNYEKFCIGIILIIIGLLLPFIVNVERFHIMEKVYNSIILKNDFLLLNAATSLVILNSIRAIPNYIGAFFIGESLTTRNDSKIYNYIKVLTICTIIPIIYFIIYIIHDIKYHFGIPAITLIFLIILLGSKNYNYVSNFKKIITIILVIFTVQILDIMPLFDKFPIGKGAMSQEIKLVSKYLQLDNFINLCSLYIFLLFSTFELLLISLINSENHLKSANILREQNILIENKSKLQELENRNYQESRQLIHDLNSPISAAQALVSLIKLNTKIENKNYEYLSEVENSLDKISKMINQSLYVEETSNITTEEIINKILSNISIFDYSDLVFVKNKCPKKVVNINLVYFMRAIINILDNAYYAIKSSPDGKIFIIIDSISENKINYVRFRIIDNGIGIPKNELPLIWNSGYSTKNTSGLGLPFVKNAIESNFGIITVDSFKNKGTEFKIIFKEMIIYE